MYELRHAHIIARVRCMYKQAYLCSWSLLTLLAFFFHSVLRFSSLDALARNAGTAPKRSHTVIVEQLRSLSRRASGSCRLPRCRLCTGATAGYKPLPTKPCTLGVKGVWGIPPAAGATNPPPFSHEFYWQHYTPAINFIQRHVLPQRCEPKTYLSSWALSGAGAYAWCAGPAPGATTAGRFRTAISQASARIFQRIDQNTFVGHTRRMGVRQDAAKRLHVQ